MEKIKKMISLIDYHILEILVKNDVDVDKLDSLTTVRHELVLELNSYISMKNTREMYDKEYWESYKKSDR